MAMLTARLGPLRNRVLDPIGELWWRAVAVGQRAHAAWQRGRAARREDAALEWQTVVVFDNVVAHRVRLPASEVLRHLDPRSRWQADTGIWSIGGGAFGAGVVFAIGLLVWKLLLTGSASGGGNIWILAGTFAAFGACMIGLPAGYLLGPKFAPKPFWLMRRLTAKRDDGKLDVTYESILHTRVTHPEWVEVRDATGDGPSRVIPQIFRASSLRATTAGLDAREFFKGPKGKWEKLEIGLMVAALLCSGGLLFLFAVTQSGAPPVP